MSELFEFLNEQSGDRLAGYGFIVLGIVYMIMQGLVYIFSSFNRNNNSNTQEDSSSDSGE